MMVGLDDSGHYKLYNLDKGSFFHSSHVRFDESVVGLEAIKRAPLEPKFGPEERAVPEEVSESSPQVEKPVGADDEPPPLDIYSDSDDMG